MASNNLSKPIIFKTIKIKSSKADTWSALTSEKELGLWWNKGVKLSPVMGGVFFEPWGNDQYAQGKVLSLKTSSMIKFSWVEKYFKSSEKTICTFKLKEVQNHIVFEVTHDGWDSFKDKKRRLELIDGFNKGWDAILSKLKVYLENKKS